MTIPLGDFQHETLDIPFSLDTNTDIDQTTLLDIIMEPPWCLNVEKMKIINKVMVTTTKNGLETAHKWLDAMLPDIYKTHIADKLDVTTLHCLSPRCLDKPILRGASTAYADMLKSQTTAASPTTQSTSQNTKPPCTKKFKLVDMTFDDQDFPHYQQRQPRPWYNTNQQHWKHPHPQLHPRHLPLLHLQLLIIKQN